MKKILFSVFSLFALLMANGQNLTKVKDAITAKKYAEANTQLDEMINNPKYQKNADLFYLKGKIFSEIAVDTNLAKNYPNAVENSLEFFKKAVSIDSNKFTMTVTLEGAQALFNIYAIPYNKGVKELDAKEYDKSLKSLQLADASGRFIFSRGLGLSPLDTNLTFYTGFAALLAGKEDVASEYFTKLANINIAEKGFEDVYKNLMIYHFNKNNIAAFEKYRTQGLKLYPKEEYFTYDEVMFINDMKDEELKVKRLEKKINEDPKNTDALSIYAELIFNKLFNSDENDTLDVKSFVNLISGEEYLKLETKLVSLYELITNAYPKDGNVIFNTGSVYQNKGYKVSNRISEINDAIKKFISNQKPDKTGKVLPAPKDLVSQRDLLREIQVTSYDKALPYFLRAETLLNPFLNKNLMSKNGVQIYKKLLDALIEIYSTKRQYSKIPADKLKFEKEELKWDTVYQKVSDIHLPESKTVKGKEVRLGMTESALIAAIGQPEIINNTVTAYGKDSQLVYTIDGKRVYFYISRGVLTAWQD